MVKAIEHADLLLLKENIIKIGKKHSPKRKKMKMSRCLIKPKDQNHQIAVGIDPPLQCWFIQVFDLAYEKIKKEEKLIIDLDSSSRWPIIEIINEYADLEDSYAAQVKDYIAMDLDPKLIPLINVT